MKVFKKTHLPDSAQYKQKVYILSEETINSIKVEVLPKKLRGCLDLHGKPYKPSVFYFNQL